MTRRTWNPAILLGIVVGASLGGIVAVILLRRSRQSAPLGLRDMPWRDVMVLIGPLLALARRLIEMSRRELSTPDIL